MPHHRVLGDGRTVVVAGGIHLDHSYLRPWLDPLAEGAARIIYYDHRGTGASTFDGDPSELNHDLWVREIDRLADEVGAERFVLLGHSYGGFLAQEYAMTHSDRLDGLILCSTAPAMDYLDVVMANATTAGSPEILEAVGQAFGTPTPDDVTLRRLWKTLLPLYFHEFDAGVAEEMDRGATYSAATFNRAFFDCLPDFCTIGRLGSIKTPVLLVVGRHDWICPPDQGVGRIQQELPDSALAVFEESGHFPFVEEHERFTATVVEWLEALPNGKT